MSRRQKWIVWIVVVLLSIVCMAAGLNAYNNGDDYIYQWTTAAILLIFGAPVVLLGAAAWLSARKKNGTPHE